MIIESAFLFILFKSVQSKINTSLAKIMCIKISILNKTKKKISHRPRKKRQLRTFQKQKQLMGAEEKPSARHLVASGMGWDTAEEHKEGFQEPEGPMLDKEIIQTTDFLGHIGAGSQILKGQLGKSYSLTYIL